MVEKLYKIVVKILYKIIWPYNSTKVIYIFHRKHSNTLNLCAYGTSTEPSTRFMNQIVGRMNLEIISEVQS